MKNQTRKTKEPKGITLIALVITILVLIILAGVTLNVLTGENGIINRAQQAKENTEEGQVYEEVQIAVDSLYLETNINSMTQEEKRAFLESELKKTDENAAVTIEGANLSVDYKNDNYKISKDREIFSAKQWDKTATPEDVFIWQSDDPTSSDYGIVIGYTANIDNYPILRYPSRCTEVQFSENLNYNGVTTSALRAFTNNILKVELPETVTKIGVYAFGEPYCKSFQKLSEVVMPDSCTEIELGAFAECKSLASINIPENVTSIGLEAFSQCISLTSINIPEKVTSIGNWAFGRCTSLTSIEIPEKVTSIGDLAFFECSSLTSVTYKGQTYTSKSSLKSALKAQGVSLGVCIFDATALEN